MSDEGSAAPSVAIQVRRACAEELRAVLSPAAAPTEVRTWPPLQRLVEEWSA